MTHAQWISISILPLGVLIVSSRFYLVFQRRGSDEKKLSEFETQLLNIHNSIYFSHYFIPYSVGQQLRSNLQTLHNKILKLNNFFLRSRLKALIRSVNEAELSLHSLRDRSNKIFIHREIQRAHNLFFTPTGKAILTEAQMHAAIADDNRTLIVAGAGSGKTTVLDYKVRYLVHHKHIDPSRILLLSFSRKSASDLNNKIASHIPGVTARTLHSFASSILGSTTHTFFDTNKKDYEAAIIKALAKTFQNRKALRYFNDFYENHFSELKPLLFYNDIKELKNDLRKLNSGLINTPDQFAEIKPKRALKTLRGEYVRSIEERYIADFLYLHDINYVYECRYPFIDSPYYPDFYLPDFDIYWEHFALSKTGEAPPFFDSPEKYLLGIQWKRHLHREQRTYLIESYSHAINYGNTAAYLSQLLRKNGVTVNKQLDGDIAYTKLSQGFCELFAKFYRTFKLSGLSIGDLKRRYPEQRYRSFLKLFCYFLENIETIYAETEKISFDDLLLKATEKIRSDSICNFDYIIVDEFQDTSRLALNLIEALMAANPNCHMTSVGDDWQSIYGFNGSDVTILSTYDKCHAGSLTLELNDNFRSHSNIVELGKQFISKNPHQRSKNVVSKNPQYKTSQIDFFELEHMQKTISSIPDDESIFVLYRYNDDAFVAQSMLQNYFYLNDAKQPMKRRDCKKNISMMTIHASKGLEAQHVFVLFPTGTQRIFPSETTDHFIFNMLKTNHDDYPFAEERRLMYVAITRAKQNLYFVSQTRDPNSIFWSELKTLTQQIIAPHDLRTKRRFAPYLNT